MIDLFSLVGAVGLALISLGIITKKRDFQNLFYIFGGLLLEAYSIYIGNWVFIILQAIFVIAAVFDLVKNNKTRLLNFGIQLFK